jgi:hemolysin III
MNKNLNGYTLGEEIANSVTHGIGAGLGITALVILVTFAGLNGDTWQVASFAIFGSTLTLAYLSSTLYHSFQSPRVKSVFRIFDHSAIFLLIAGTYTPFTLVNMRGGWGWTLFGSIWGFAIGGVVLKAIFIDRLRAIPMIMYVCMGWLIVIALKPLLTSLPVEGFVWLFIGGLSYTLGLIFFAWNSLPFNHAIWHLFVLGGSVCHFFCMLFYTLPNSA